MIKFIAIFSIFILLAVGVIYFVFNSHFLRVAAVEVSGSDRADEIKEALIGNLLKSSKIRSLFGPDNLLFWPLEISKTSSNLYWLSGLSLKRDWEKKRIVIEVKEREPWLLWCLQTTPIDADTDTDAVAVAPARINADKNANKQKLDISENPRKNPRESAIYNCYWLDEQGIVFSSAPEAEGLIIPKVFETDDRQQLFWGQLFCDNPQLAANVLEIIKQLKNSSLVIRRFLIENINLQELKAETEGPKLYFSFRFLPQDLDKILANLADRLDFQKLGYIDFRVENRIYYK